MSPTLLYNILVYLYEYGQVISRYGVRAPNLENYLNNA